MPASLVYEFDSAPDTNVDIAKATRTEELSVIEMEILKTPSFMKMNYKIRKIANK